MQEGIEVGPRETSFPPVVQAHAPASLASGGNGHPTAVDRSIDRPTWGPFVA